MVSKRNVPLEVSAGPTSCHQRHKGRDFQCSGLGAVV